jgi:putative membrane protein insertion efficiency factor
MKQLILSIIRLYQKTGNLRNVFSKGTCRFQPTCAQYLYEAIERYGIMKGIVLGVKRIAKCHPWSKGGIDPIPNL